MAVFVCLKYIGILNPGKEDPSLKEPLEDLSDVLDVSQLAKVLHLSRSGAYNLLNKQDFPTLHVGGKKMVMKQALIEWMHQHAVLALEYEICWDSSIKGAHNEAYAAVEDFVNGKESTEQFAIRLDKLVSQMQGS